MKKIGILGGTFDPVHWGHINLAMDAREKAGLDKVIFVPAGRQPFKLYKEITPGSDRLSMLEKALNDIDGLEVSSYELDSEGVSYTYLTLRAMQQKFGPEAKLYFIMGTDSFLKLDLWTNAREMMENYAYIIGTRPGYRQRELEQCIERVHREHDTEIENIDNRQFDVSSTEIRDRLGKGIPCGDLVPETVEEYIRDNGLYKG